MREVINHWWVLGLRAILALVLAVVIFLLQAWAKLAVFDAVTVPFVIAVLSVYAILDSCLLIFLGMQFAPHSPSRAISITQGVCGVVLGGLLLTVFFRTVEVRWFITIITALAVANGIFELLSGLRFTSHVKDEWACFATGAASIAFAILLQVGFDGSTPRALDWFLGYALLLSASMAWFGYRLFVLHREMRLEVKAVVAR